MRIEKKAGKWRKISRLGDGVANVGNGKKWLKVSRK